VVYLAFVVYKPRGKKKEDPLPVISFSKSSIVFNKTARQMLNSQHVELAYDDETKTVRVRPADDGMQLKKTRVFGKGFFKRFNIHPRGKAQARYSDGALYADISSILT
jgi:ethanolamine utilization cobalamin adenosyltransferase